MRPSPEGFEGLTQTLGFRVLDQGAGSARVELPLTPAVHNPVGVLHGGAMAALIDDAATVAILTGDVQGRPGLTTDLHVSYLAPGRGSRVIAQARARKIGRTLAFAEVEVVGDDGTLLALGRVTKMLPT